MKLPVSVWLLCGAVALPGCASLPPERGYRETRDLVADRVRAPMAAARSTSAPDPVEGDLSLDRAIALTLQGHPRVRSAMADIGIARSELDEARRLPNPEFGVSRQRSDEGGHRFTRRLGWDIADALMLRARTRLAEGGLDQAQFEAAEQVVDLVAEVERAWIEAVAAHQVAAMRGLVSRAAKASSSLAERFFAAGNISALQLEHERAAATRASLEAARADVQAMATRLRLASLTGAAVESAWRLPTSLPLPQPDALQPDEVVELAMTQRLDLAAARRSLALHDDALALTRRWRWLGTVHLEYEREREADGVQLSGPGLSLQLPIFNQGQPAVARASSERDRAQAHLDLLLAQTIEESRAGLAAMRARAGMIDRYREALVPGRERIVELTQRRFDFMLVGAFDLLATKQMQYDTYQAYLESVRDYWTARSSLRRVVGGRLPDDGVAAGESSAIDYMLPTEDDSGTPVHRHGSAPGAAHGSMHQGSHGAQSNRSGADTATNTQAGSAQDSGHASHHGEAGHQHGAVSEGVQAHAEDRDDDGRQRAEGRAHHDAHHHGAGHAPDGANASGREPRS